MKNRNIIAVLSALVALALLPIAQADPAPNPPAPGVLNTRDGQSAMPFVTTGVANSAFGAFAQFSVTTGNNNTAVGVAALDLNNANNNTAVGTAALLLNTTGTSNTAVGAFALFNNIGGGPTMGTNNTAVGANALDANTTGNFNTALGSGALGSNTTGSVNVAVGGALSGMTSGNSNVAIGGNAGVFLDTGSGNVYLGQGVGGVAVEDNHTYIRNIKDTTVTGVGADVVTIDLTTGLLGHNLSSRRYKEDIKPMDKTSEALFALKPVTYRYKKEVDKTQSLDYGLIAEDVAKIDPNLAVHNGKGEVENVRYNAINAMLLNEFLKEHKKVQSLEATVAQQKKGMDVLTAQLKEQAAQIQKVSAQLEVDKPATKVALGNQ
jgi:hypothetical protein